MLWDIYTGTFSPTEATEATEATGVTVGFGVIVGSLCLPLYRPVNRGRGGERPGIEERGYAEMLVVRGFGPLELPSITMPSARITGILAPLIAVSIVMQEFLSVLGAQEVIGDFVTGMGGYHAVLFTAMAIVFAAGMVLESLPVTIILVPILAPSRSRSGWSRCSSPSSSRSAPRSVSSLRPTGSTSMSPPG